MFDRLDCSIVRVESSFKFQVGVSPSSSEEKKRRRSSSSSRRTCYGPLSTRQRPASFANPAAPLVCQPDKPRLSSRRTCSSIGGPSFANPANTHLSFVPIRQPGGIGPASSRRGSRLSWCTRGPLPGFGPECRLRHVEFRDEREKRCGEEERLT